jgi:hypothetical protein
LSEAFARRVDADKPITAKVIWEAVREASPKGRH